MREIEAFSSPVRRRRGARFGVLLTVVGIGLSAWVLAALQPSASTLSSGTQSLQVANALRLEGHSDRARAMAASFLSSESPEEVVRARALLARMEIAEGRRAAGLRELRETMEESARLGLDREAVADALTVSFYLTTQLRDFEGAERVLERAEVIGRRYPEGGAEVAYYRGLLAVEIGDFRRGMSALHTSLEGAARLGLDRVERNARQELALLHARFGRYAEAIAEQSSVLAETPEELACDRANAHANLAWIAFLAEDSDVPLGVGGVKLAVEPELERADRALSLCGDRDRLQIAAVNRALWALHDGDPAKAAQYLERAGFDRVPPRGSLALWALEIEARIHYLGRRHAEALAIFERQAVLARAALDLDAELRGYTGQGEVEATRGDLTRSIAAYELAEERLRQEYRRVPFGYREEFLGARDGGTRRLVEALIEQGETARAYRIARYAQSRALRSIADQWHLSRASAAVRSQFREAVGEYQAVRSHLDSEAGSDWQRSGAELEQARRERAKKMEQARAGLDQALARIAPAAAFDPFAVLESEVRARSGESTLLFYRAFTAWWAFLEIDGQVRAARFDPSRPDLPLLEEVPSRTPLLRVLLPPALQGLDIHSFPVMGAPLLARAAVVYALDLPAVPGLGVQAAAPAAPVRIAVALNPTRDLPASEEEVGALSDLEPSARIDLAHGEEVTRARTLELMSSASIFHYSGHAESDHATGEANLVLAAGSKIVPEDVLALSVPPRVAVLSACGSAETPRAGAGLGWSVGHGLLLAGSEAVVATVREVSDRESARFGRLLYRELGDAELAHLTALDVSRAVRRASLQAREQGLSGWEAYRVYVR